MFDDPGTTPKADDIMSAKEHLENKVWNKAHSNWATVESYYQRTFPVWDQEIHNANRPKYRPSTPTRKINTAADTQLAFQPRIHREPVGDTEDDKISANRLEEALSAILSDSALSLPSLVWKTMGKHFLLYGYASIEGPYYNPDTGKFTFYSPNPKRILADPCDQQPNHFIKVETMYAYRLEELSKEKESRADSTEYKRSIEMGPYDEVEVIKFRSANWFTLVISGSGQKLFSDKNTYGFVPFAHSFSGYGQELTSDNATAPEHLAVGILDGSMESIKMEAQSLTSLHQLEMESAWAPMGTTQDPAEAAHTIARAQILQGDQSDFWKMDVNQVQSWQLNSASRISADIDEAIPSRVLSGLREPGTLTVGQQAHMATAAMKKFQSPAEKMSQLASISVANVMRIADATGDAISVAGKRLTKSDIKGDFNLRVSFESTDPVLDLQRRQLGLQEVSSGVKSIETYLEEDARSENPQREKRRIIQEDVMRDPAVQAIMAGEAAKEMGIEDIFTEAAKLKAQISKGAAPPMVGVGASPNGTLRQPISPDTVQPPRLEGYEGTGEVGGGNA